MQDDTQENVTALLAAASAGDDEALNRLMPRVYDQLRILAGSVLRHRRPGHTLGVTSLIHEAYLKLVDQSSANWESRSHFFGVAAKAMRSILVDYARRRGAQRRGGDRERMPLEEALQELESGGTDVVALDEALDALAEIDERKTRVVELRFFGGLGIEETAEILGVGTATIERDWRWAKAWLYRELSGDE